MKRFVEELNTLFCASIIDEKKLNKANTVIYAIAITLIVYGIAVY